ncbi:hypothetical protein NLI96_g7062 [Meripilus lineatus]|uniref:laccase n=1 Tax=Meripilus lineatus TaxID=2056292 RepID=A0AAD5UZU1_9APHY|nr:hypothetical protein NLI96_g7062 [Physisporinus lineatus]
MVAPDGFSRSAVVAEGSTPGPLIRGNKGDTFQINVKNGLTDESLLTSTSIHWHGLFQYKTNWDDGAAWITQCPIGPGRSFLYNFTIAEQAGEAFAISAVSGHLSPPGTFWYHSHLSTQYCDGLRGPLVIYDPEDPHKDLYDVDDEGTIITLSDWYHQPSKDLPVPPTSWATLINGLGRSSNGSDTNLTVIEVEQGKRYRFRLVSLSCEPTYQFSIDGHTLTVIEAEGTNTQPVQASTIPIFASQRYSFVLEANQPVGNYWIRALPNFGNTSFAGGINSAILRYVGAPDEEPTKQLNSSAKPLVETDLHPLVPTPPPPHADLPLEFAFSFNNGRFYVNNVSFSSPSVPELLQILSGSQRPQDLLPQGSVYLLPKDSTIEIKMPGGVIGGGHPLHLHGHNFWVMQSAGSNTTNLQDPVLRDTVNIGSLGDEVTIRFQTNNPGPWLLHCHIDFHFDTGFAVVFAEDVPDISADGELASRLEPVMRQWFLNSGPVAGRPSRQHPGVPTRGFTVPESEFNGVEALEPLSLYLHTPEPFLR